MRFKLISSLASLRNRRHQALLGLVSITAFVAVACGSAEPTATPPSTSTAVVDAPTGTSTPVPTVELPYGVTGPPAPPQLDTSTAIVSPEDIIFDTFNGRSVALSDADQETIDRLFNAIKPVYTPAYVDAEESRWLFDRDFVVGYEGDSQAYAYPVKFLNSHEIVNDEIDGIPILVTYCPLCGSGVVFDRRLNGETHIFGNTSALYQNDLVIVDHETGSYWFQTGGEAVIGPLSGNRLDPLPSVMMPWSE